ncbi:threonine/serine exporter family protein [Plantibacter flavus]|uniref:threonine/serine ThrE exporter family protein n=1 Tax=Plantibacter flavus TaxID=150123 RepID=UPI003F164845
MGLRSMFGQLAGSVGGAVPEGVAEARSARLNAERPVREVLELAGRIGESMLSLGAAAAEVTDAIRRVCRAFDLECQVDLTFTSILIAHDGSERSPGVTVLRVVAAPAADYDRLAKVVTLSETITTRTEPIMTATDAALDDETDLRDELHERLGAAHRELDRILGARRTYRRGLITALLSLMAAAVSVLLGGGVLSMLLAAATTALIDSAFRALGVLKLPVFFLQLAGAAIATTVAVLISVLSPYVPADLSALPPALVVASGIVVLLAGASLVGAADDALNGFPVTASGRLVEVLLLTIGIVVGIGGVLDLARRLGVSLVLIDLPVSPWPIAVQVVGAAVASAAWAMASYATIRTACFAGVTGAVAFAVSTSVTGSGVNPAAASALAALVIGFAAEALGPRLRIPAIILTICGIVPLLPGLAIYRGMLALVNEEHASTGTELLLQAGLTGLALAAGVTLGEILARRSGVSHRVLLPGYIRRSRRRPR